MRCSMAFEILLAILFSCAGTVCITLAINSFLQNRRLAKKQDQKAINAITEKVLSQIEPLLVDAHSVADSFEEHVAEKKLIISEINEALEKRIASLTLLLNRADAIIARKKESHPQEDSRQRVFDSKEKILRLAAKGANIDEIANRLSLPKGEVALVVSLHHRQSAG